MSTAAEKPETVQKVLWHARRLARTGRMRDAYDLLLRLRDYTKDQSTVFQIQQRYRNVWLRDLRRQFPDREACPLQAVGLKVRGLKLKPHEAYLLDLFDGGTSLDDALAVSPVDELETLAAIARFVEKGYLTIPADHAGL